MSISTQTITRALSTVAIDPPEPPYSLTVAGLDSAADWLEECSRKLLTCADVVRESDGDRLSAMADELLGMERRAREYADNGGMANQPTPDGD